MRHFTTLVFGCLTALLCLTASAQPEMLRPAPDNGIETQTNESSAATTNTKEVGSEPQDESDSEIQCDHVELAIPFDENFTDTVRQLLTENAASLPSVMGSILSYAPSESGMRIGVLSQLSANQNPIAEQCDCLPLGLSAQDIFSGGLTAGISPNLLAHHCLDKLSPEMIPDILIASLTKLQSAQYATFFQEVNEILTRTGLNGREVLVESLIAGEFLREDDVDVGCVGDCITPLAEALVDQLLTEDPADAPSEPDSEDEGDEDDEENFSFS